MTVDLEGAKAFLATHARVLDRRRLALLLGDGPARGVLDAVEAYGNPDGGYGWGLEPDLRSEESQPAAALHAFEAFAEAAPATTPRVAALCDWLQSTSLPDGGLPFALPIGDSAGCAPWWVGADQTASSLQITAAVAANAHRLARHDDGVARHPWLATATRYCLDAIRAVDEAPHAYELSFALQLLDAVADDDDDARRLLDHLGRYVPPDGVLPLAGGTETEALRPLDVAPHPGRPVRALFADDVVDADLQRLADQQQPDGGWPVEWASSSPAAALEWRGYVTVRAVAVLQANRAA
jgi:hypothetical protein